LLTASAVLRGRRPGAGDCASLSIGTDVHDRGPFLGLDLKAGVDQSLHEDLGRFLRVRDRRKVVAVGRELSVATDAMISKEAPQRRALFATFRLLSP
jgi:hypothetical protein